jgi:predicted metalloprotease with PDZ domain
MRNPGRFIQSISESSFDAWTKFYKQDENAPNAIVSYYVKGALVAFGLDMELRMRTSDRVNLDNLMRALWERFGKHNIGVPENGVEKLANELAETDLSDFFNRFVHATDELPLAEWFTVVGVGFCLRAAQNSDDQGGYGENTTTEKVPLVLGACTRSGSLFVEITHVITGGAAHKAGLSSGDRIIALDGVQVRPDTLAKRIEQGREGAARKIHAFRRDELMTFELIPQRAQLDTCDLWLLDKSSLSDMQKKRRNAWLVRMG